MQSIWVPGVLLLDTTPKDGEQHFCNGVYTHQQGCKGGHTRVALDEQDSHPGQGKANEVGAPIAQKDLAKGPVDPEEAPNTGCAHQGNARQTVVPHLPCDHGVAYEGQCGHGAGQAVEAVDDVDGVGHTTHSKCGEDDRHHCVLHQPVHTPNVNTAKGIVRDPPGHQTRGHGGQ